MSITPVTTAPSAPAAGCVATEAPSGKASGAFALLVAGLLGSGQPGPDGAPVAPAPADVVAGGTDEETGEDGPTCPAVPGAASLVDLSPVLPAPVPLAPAAEAGTAAAATGAVLRIPSASGESAVPARPTAAVPDVVLEAGTAPVTTPTLVRGVPVDVPTHVSSSTAPAPDQRGRLAEGAADVPVATAASASAAAVPSADTTPAPAPVVPATVPAPVAASAATSPGAAPAAATSPAPVDQVVPEVTRLVSRGNGVHRLTMKLQPEALGEVRVTLTVRDGSVDVRLSGGDAAARALAEGAPELRRVLELAGAGEARVVVRDLAGQPAPGHQPVGTTAQGTTTDLRGGAGDHASAGGGTGTHDQHDQHARTRGGAGARDGLTDGADRLRPEPVTGARQGIDLTM